MTEDWVEKADAGREAWEAMGAVEREDLLLELRWDASRGDWAKCPACSDCTEPYGHTTPHTCDCAEAWS